MSSLWDLTSEKHTGHNFTTISLSSYNTQEDFSVLSDCAFSIVTFIGLKVNYKLYNKVRKEKHTEAGKVLQWIMKAYALMQAITCLGYWVIQELLSVAGWNSLTFLHPCNVLNTSHLLIFTFLFFQLYFGIVSLSLAIGRYAFVVQSGPISRFGVQKFGNILIWSSFVIPLFMSLLTSAVQTIEYSGIIAPLKVYELSCSFLNLKEFKVNTSTPCYNCYRSPIYNLTHSYLQSSTINAMWIFNVFAYCILYSNATEGIIYIRSAIFVFR